MIRTRLTLWNTAVFALALTLIGTAIYFTTKIDIYRAVDEDMRERASFLERSWKLGPPHGGPDDHHDHGPDQGPGQRDDDPPNGPPRGGPPDRGPRDDRIRGGPPDGMPPGLMAALEDRDPIEAKRLRFIASLTRPRIFHKDDQQLDPPHEKPFDAAALKLSMVGVEQFQDIVMDGHRVRILSLPLRSDGKVSGAAQFASQLDDIDLVVVRLRNILLALLPLSLLATSLLGNWLTKRALSPVKRIAAAAEQIGETNLSDRLPVEGNDEFAYLSGRFNIMIERIEGSFDRLSAAYEAQRRFIADASHELKTPLTVIKGRVGLSGIGEQSVKRYTEHMEAINRASDSMSSIIQGLLFLARADENKLNPNRERSKVRSIVAESIAAVANPTGRAIECEVPSGLEVDADSGLLTRAIVNLLGNAVRHTPLEKRVGVRASGEDDKVAIQIWDEGEGIPAEHLPLIFNRFHRVDSSRDRMSGGTGLGLAIVKSIVEAHGGTITVESEEGVGTTATIRLPKSA